MKLNSCLGNTSVVNGQFERLKSDLDGQRQLNERCGEQIHATNEAILRLVAKRNAEALSSMGIDPAKLKEYARDDHGQIRELIEKLRTQQKGNTPQKTSSEERALRNALSMHTRPAKPQIHEQLIPPAYRCTNGQGQTCFAETGSLCMQLHSSGVGGIWGWEATPYVPPITNSIVFVYIPQIPGVLTVTAQVDTRGSASIYTDNPGFWVRADSFLTMRMNCSISQDSQFTQGSFWNVIDKHLSDSHETDNFNHYEFEPSCNAYVQANDLVFVSVGAELSGEGRSSYGHVDLDVCMDVIKIDVSLDTAPNPI